MSARERRRTGEPRAPRARLFVLASSCALALACRSSGGAPPAEADTAAIEATLDELYRAFDFDAGGEADWSAIRALALDGAVFVAPVAAGRPVRAVGTEEFLRDFRRYVASAEVRATGLHERIVAVRVDRFGAVAHAYVAFEGSLPATGTAVSRGLDSVQLVLDQGRWKLVSFTTQYASADAPLPGRFLAGTRGASDR